MLALAILALSAGTVLAETYIEAYLGNNFTVSSPNPLELDVNPAFRGPTTTSLNFPRTLGSAFMVGGKLGFWFSKDGFPKLDYPDWMKYLGFYLDCSVHGFLPLDNQGSQRLNFSPSPYPHYVFYKFKGGPNASITTISFMFAFRYGFFPRKKVPFGKLQPYAAVGPAIFITSLQPTLLIQPKSVNKVELFPTVGNYFRTFTGSFKSAVTLGLATELGLRYMITRFLSLETSVKYRLTRPSLSYDINIDGFTHQLTYAPQLNLFSIQTGIAYHF